MSEKNEVPYIIVEKSGNLGAFLWGAVAGAVVALLFAPKSGEETQEELKEGARRLKDDAEERITELRRELEEGYERARTDLSQRLEEAREEVRERRLQAEEALKAGRDAARRARGDLERRVAESKAAYRAGNEQRAAAEAAPPTGESEPETPGA